MITNLDRYKKDLDRLITDGHLLHLSFWSECQPEDFREKVVGVLGGNITLEEATNLALPFNHNYQAWYSESKALLKQLMPDRLSDFVRHYERPKTARRQLTNENYVIEDALQGLSATAGVFQEKVADIEAALPLFTQQLRIIEAVKRRFDSTLFDIKQLVQADVFDSELSSATELMEKGFLRAAGAIAGVVLEGHLAQVCENHSVKIRKKHPGINDFAQLLKNKEVIDTPVWRKIQHLADIRNLCDHKKDRAPTVDEIAELIEGVQSTIKTLY